MKTAAFLMHILFIMVVGVASEITFNNSREESSRNFRLEVPRIFRHPWGAAQNQNGGPLRLLHE